MKTKGKSNKGITLIALVITIILLIILAAVTLSIVLGENGLISKAKKGAEEYQYAGLREKIESEILALDMEKVVKGEKLTVEEALRALYEKGTFSEIDEQGSIGICEGYTIQLGYNEDRKVVIDGIQKDTGLRVTTRVTPNTYTNGNVTVEISVSGQTITNVTVPSGMTKQGDSWIYQVTANGTYKVEVTIEDGQKLEKEIKISTIDRVVPKDFTPTTEFIKSGFKIIAEAEDGDATEQYVQSGIDHYEYYVDDTKQNSNIISGLQEEKNYKVYVIAYDKAKNEKKSNEISVVYKEQVPVITLDTDDWVNDKVIATVDWGFAEDTDKKEISLDGGETYEEYIGPTEVTKNTTIKAKLTSGEKELIGELKVTKIDKLAPDEFTPTISDLDSDTEFTISAKTTDKDATEEDGKSEIDGYEYFVYKGDQLIDSSGKITQTSWKASNLEVGETYRVQVDAYDKAKNKTSEEIENYTKLEVYQWAQYAADVETIYDYTTTYYGKKYYKQTDSGPTIYYGKVTSFKKSTGRWDTPNSSKTKNINTSAMKGTAIACSNTTSPSSVYQVLSAESSSNNYLGGQDLTIDANILKSYSQTTYTKKGEILKYVASNNPEQYPENGGQGNYWYEKVSK